MGSFEWARFWILDLVFDACFSTRAIIWNRIMLPRTIQPILRRPGALSNIRAAAVDILRVSRGLCRPRVLLRRNHYFVDVSEGQMAREDVSG